jgi:hypothetical protein
MLLLLYAHYTDVIPVYDLLWVKSWYSSLMMGPFFMRGYPSGRHELLFPPRSGRTWLLAQMVMDIKSAITVNFFLFRSVLFKWLCYCFSDTFSYCFALFCAECAQAMEGECTLHSSKSYSGSKFE